MSKTKTTTTIYPLDEHCDLTGEVLVKNDDAYTCVLNQTDLISNKNKFYNMQIVRAGTKYCHFIRYGRISEPGKIITKDYASEGAAISAFEKQFKSKTKNNWSNRANFVKADGMYFLSDIKYETDEVPEEAKMAPPISVLDERVQNLIKLFTNQTTMQNTLISLEVNTEKMPLGKISKKQLDSAQNILAQIKKLVKSDKKRMEGMGAMETAITITITMMMKWI